MKIGVHLGARELVYTEFGTIGTRGDKRVFSEEQAELEALGSSSHCITKAGIIKSNTVKQQLTDDHNILGFLGTENNALSM